MKSAVFLDRDGTLNVRPPEHEYITDPDDFVWLAGARQALANLAAAGYTLAVVSNQRGVARGFVSVDVLNVIEGKIQTDLAPLGCSIAAFRYCVHDGERCACRKPKPGMLLELARDLQLDLESSWMVGDAESDAEAGRLAGCSTALLGEGLAGCEADVHAAHLLAASRLIIGRQPESPAVSSMYVRRSPS
jgi:histidinol-phosphate phosphatase family protein